MKHLKRFNENVSEPFGFRGSYELDEWIEKNYPTLIQYRDDNCQLDDLWYSIPYDVFNKITGLDKGDIERMSSGFDAYEGGISCYNDTVEIFTGV